MANPHLVDTRLHRPVVFDHRPPCDGTCETACGCLCVHSSLPAPLPPVSEEPDDSIGVKLGLLSVFLVAIGAAVALVWP